VVVGALGVAATATESEMTAVASSMMRLIKAMGAVSARCPPSLLLVWSSRVALPKKVASSHQELFRILKEAVLVGTVVRLTAWLAWGTLVVYTRTLLEDSAASECLLRIVGSGSAIRSSSVSSSAKSVAVRP